MSASSAACPDQYSISCYGIQLELEKDRLIFLLTFLVKTCSYSHANGYPYAYTYRDVAKCHANAGTNCYSNSDPNPHRVTLLFLWPLIF